MKIQLDQESFRFFPYPPDGKENQGGIDLLKQPERIDEINEFKKFPALKRFVKWINFETDKFRTFGCDGGWDEGTFLGYIEFSFRDSKEAQQFELYKKLFDDFEVWVKEKYPEGAIPILSNLKPYSSAIWMNDKPFGNKIVLWFFAENEAYAENLLDIFFGFLKARAGL